MRKGKDIGRGFLSTEKGIQLFHSPVGYQRNRTVPAAHLGDFGLRQGYELLQRLDIEFHSSLKINDHFERELRAHPADEYAQIPETAFFDPRMGSRFSLR